jgi:hypothetical protein
MHHSLMNSSCILSWAIKVLLNLCLLMAFQVAKPTSTSVFFQFCDIAQMAIIHKYI